MSHTLAFEQPYNFIKDAPQVFFAIVALFFGGLFIFIVPPLQTPDEATHFLRAYQISEGKFIAQNVNGVTGDYLPSSIQKTFTILEKNGPIQFNSNKKYDHHQTKAALLDVPLSASERQFYDISSASTYSPIAYLPQAIGIFLAKMVNSPVVIMLYIARLFNLIFWVGMLYVAIRLFPWKKWAFAGIALLPMVVAQSASTGIDVVSVGAGAVFIALIFHLFDTKKKINIKLGLFLIITATVMLLSKQVMAVFLPLLLLLKKSQFEDGRHYWLFIMTAMFVPLIFFVLWSLIIPETSQNITQVQSGQNTGEQVRYILSQPWQFAKVVIFTFFFTWGDGVWLSLMGNFGWVDTPLAGLFIVVGYIGLAAYVAVNYESSSISKKLGKWARWLLIILAAGYSMAVCLAMYVLYSPLKYDIIVGIQGRYFFPVLFLLLPLALSNIVRTKKDFFVHFTIIFTLIMLTASIITIIFRYYLTYL